MKNNSGWGWNEDLGNPDCDDLAWSEWIDTHKDCVEFKQNGVWESFPWYNEMDFIFQEIQHLELVLEMLELLLSI